LRDEFLLGGLDELTTAGFALVILSPVMDKTIFDDVVRFAAWATWHGASGAKDVLMILSLHLGDYPQMFIDVAPSSIIAPRSEIAING
jgi:hypothetical protein